MTDIEIYRKVDNPIDPSLLEIEISNQSFSQFLSDNDKAIIEREWVKVKKKNPKAFYNENGNGSLHDTTNNTLTFFPTDFRVYVAGPRTSASGEMSQKFYSNMRIASIGAVVRGKDGKLCVHQRSPGETHVPNAWDSSVAGIARARKNSNGSSIDTKVDLYEKLDREIGIQPTEISRLGVSGVHHVGHPDYSGMVDFVVDTKIDSEEIIQRALEIESKKIDSNNRRKWQILNQPELPDFVLSHYDINRGHACLDGGATLMMSMAQKDFDYTLRELRNKGMTIEFGQLEDGLFVPDWPRI